MIAIAIVEDDQQEQKRLQQYLMRYAMENQQTFSFALYSNALDYLEDKQKFDIVFMDIMLPNMTGMEAAARMREYDSKTVLIFVTTMVQFAIKSYEADVDAACDRAGIIERAQICLHAFKQRHTLWLCAGLHCEAGELCTADNEIAEGDSRD